MLPPLPAYQILMPWVLVPLAGGLAYWEEDKSDRLIPWPDLKPVVEGSQLILSVDHRLRFPSEAAVQAWRERLQRWQSMSQAAREADFLKFIKQTSGSQSLDLAMRALSAQTRGLRWLGALIFFICFGAVTIVYRRFGDGPEVLWVAGALVSLLWLQAVLFWRATARLKSPLKYRFWKTLAIAFLPQNAMRAADHLCEAQTHAAHPLAAAALMLEPVKLKLARGFWKSIPHVSSDSAALQRKALEVALGALDLTPEQMEEVPEKQPGSAAYCPRCQAQFRDAQALCQDCGGLPLKAF